ncbi:hypothetical protein PHMEG_00024655 [Phytophthora megakarya]|uniref:Uncharacterized protein n=1 Tax=Phytophthora megakarya TaxID=4795 RepID=A0A225VF78_9STRA|nr:hypothetical protein PHMEG_00024655 [Phytophthora megakarya]
MDHGQENSKIMGRRSSSRSRLIPYQQYFHLQEIIRKYPADFASKTNNGNCDDSSSETKSSHHN